MILMLLFFFIIEVICFYLVLFLSFIKYFIWDIFMVFVCIVVMVINVFYCLCYMEDIDYFLISFDVF